ncbi:MAG: hypothetical protein N4A41_09450 [Crocinitomicaceae bacterium]|jgi:hypothetical protein|nr:hypothetical protein [Crocinitomicaceae bacterium]
MKKNERPIAIGALVGLLLGLIIGLAEGNWGVWIGPGIAIGSGVGSVWLKKKQAKETQE